MTINHKHVHGAIVAADQWLEIRKAISDMFQQHRAERIRFLSNAERDLQFMKMDGREG